MPSFSIPLTGLEADSTALNTIASNLSNMNTTAYKAQTVAFSDLFYQQIGSTGGGDPEQLGAGTRVAAITSNFSANGTSATGNSTDMALNGDGFFVVSQGGSQLLTRAGNFSLDQNGNLTTASGASVMGFPAPNGVVNPNAPLVPLAIPIGAVEQPQATAGFHMTANLDASAPVGTSVPATITVYDSLGSSHQMTVTFTKGAVPNQWSYSIDLPAGDYTGAPVNNTGILTFDSSGNLVSPAGSVTGIQFPGLSDSANDLSFTWNLYDANGSGAISQVANASSVAATFQDGFSSGQYQDFSVDSNGVVSAHFSNGQIESVGQVAVATIVNEQGLSRVGSNNFETTLASGQAVIGVAGSSGRGAIQDGALEQSNVDISTEFSNLIIAQRAFEANSKAITTFDTVTQDTINMLH